MTQVELSSSTF